MNETQQPPLLSAEVRSEIDHWTQKYPAEHRQSAMLYALRAAQTANGGWLTRPLMDACADYLGVPRIAAYECATFYSMYQHQPVGRHVIHVCTSLSCQLRGAEKIVHHLENRLGIKMGETTADGAFTLKEVECLAACGGAPAIQVDDQTYHEDLTPEKVDALIQRLKDKK